MTGLITTSANAVVSIMTLTPIDCIDRRVLRAGNRPATAENQIRKRAAKLHPVTDSTDLADVQEGEEK